MSQEHGYVHGQYRTGLPKSRESRCHKIKAGELDMYAHIGLYPDGRPGEVFLTAAKQGSLVAGLLDGLAIAVSIALQYGAPVDVFSSLYQGMTFEPMDPQHTSILDALSEVLAEYRTDLAGDTE